MATGQARKSSRFRRGLMPGSSTDCGVRLLSPSKEIIQSRGVAAVCASSHIRQLRGKQSCAEIASPPVGRCEGRSNNASEFLCGQPELRLKTARHTGICNAHSARTCFMPWAARHLPGHEAFATTCPAQSRRIQSAPCSAPAIRANSFTGTTCIGCRYSMDGRCSFRVSA